MSHITRAASVALTTATLAVATAAPAFAAPNPTPGLPAGVEGQLDTLLGMFMAIVIVGCVAGIFICAGKMALNHQRGGGEAAGGLIAVLFACILVGAGAGIVNYLV